MRKKTNAKKWKQWEPSKAKETIENNKTKKPKIKEKTLCKAIENKKKGWKIVKNKKRGLWEIKKNKKSIENR